MAVSIAVRRDMIAHPFFDGGHDFQAQGGGLFIHAEAFFLVFDAQQVIAAFRQPHHAEHADEILLLDEPFRHQEVGFEEGGFLHDEFDPLIHVFQLQVDVPGQHILNEILRALGVQGAFIQPHAGQREAAAADGQAVIAGSDGVLIAPFLHEHAMVGKGGFGGFQHALDAGQGEIVAGPIRVVPQGQVGDRQLHFFGQFQQKAARHGILQPDVGVHEGIRLHPVNIAQEQPQHLLGIGPVLPQHKGLQQLVQITQVNGIGGNGRHVAVEDFQYVHGFQQVLGRVQFQKRAALLKQQRIIRADIPGPIGHHALVQVAQSSFFLGGVIRVGITQGIVGAFAQAGQRDQLLPVGQRGVLYDF